jgi:hypothetical protein
MLELLFIQQDYKAHFEKEKEKASVVMRLL